jgi:hypothetical protein
VVVIVTSLGLAGLWIAAAIGRWTLPPLRIWGIGFAVFGLGLLPLALGIREDGSIAMFAVGSVITAAGETAIAPMAMTYAALAARPRAAALLLAGLSLVSWMASSGGSGMAGSPAQTPVLIVMGVVSLLIGVVAGSLAPTIHRKLFAA